MALSSILRNTLTLKEDALNLTRVLRHWQSIVTGRSVWHPSNESRILALQKAPEYLGVIFPSHSSNGGPTEGEHDTQIQKETLISNSARLLFWCSQARIRNLSIYDPSGTLSNPNLHPEIENEFVRLWNDHTTNASPQISFGRSGTEKGLSLCILNRSDGREPIARMILKMRADSTPTLTHAQINSYLIENVSASPDLLVVYGRNRCFYGYPPWQLQRAEIFHVPLLGRLTVESFLEALEAYSGAEMRWGK